MADSQQVFTKFPGLSKEIQLMIWEAALPDPRIVELCEKPLRISISEWNRQACPENYTHEQRAHHLFVKDESGRTRISRILGLADWDAYYGALFFKKYFAWLGMEEEFRLADEYLSEQDCELAIEKRLMDVPMPGITSMNPPPPMFFTCRDSYAVASAKYHKVFGTLGTFPETYFNPSQDTLYVGSDSFASRIRRPLRDFIAHLDTIVDVESLKRVENLAVSLDVGYHLELTPLVDRIYRFLDQVLDIFSNLKNLTLVLGHYGWFESADDPCVLLAPFTINGTYSYEETFRPDMSIEHNVRVPLCFQLDLEKLELKKTRAVEDGRGSYEIPEIHYKVSASLSFKRAMDSFVTPRAGIEPVIL